MSGLLGVSTFGTLGTPTSFGTNLTGADTALGNFAFLTQDTGAVINSQAGLEFPLHLVTASSPTLVNYFRISSLADVRLFIGYSDQTLATMAGSDNPAGSYIGLQFSSARGDTNWQYVAKDGTTQLLTDSGVAASTNFFILRIGYDPAAIVHMALFNNSWSPLGSVVDLTTNLPANTISVRLNHGIQNLVAASKTLQVAFIYEVESIS